MATVEGRAPIVVPTLQTPVKDFIPYLSKNATTPIASLLEPYKVYESELRKVYAQQPDHEAVLDGHVNLVPLFDGHEAELTIRARSLDTESDDEKSRFIMSLRDEDRKPNGAPAIVSSFKDFQQNFNLFSESSLADLNWDNVVAAGSSVTMSLLPVPEKWAGNKRNMREYYHEHFAPASDVDLFLYGLNEEQALEKIKQIERSVKDSLLHEVTTIRTKNAITIASQYPTRHVQIVLRLYDSISQIITGFDVDCSCAAYTGSQVFAAPRAIAAFVTQCNTIDLARRSPSYENRLSKYSHRGFEVHWPLLDRTRIDPTIFERSFGRTQGLARLLILERLPKSVDRDAYMDQRRAERGRPAIHRNFRDQYKLGGNIKDQEEDEVAEWVEQEEVASYHTMTVPYGLKYHAAKIDRLLYAKDLLLNAEWNQDSDRDVYLHRHPCFFGTAEEVLGDCCGYCPAPKTDEEFQVHEEETKFYVSGALKFLVEDPGRQEIGSFNPITDDEWTTMAYVGDTARLCQAIVDGDHEHVLDWCSQEGVDVNRRDFTGRTPLHLAVMSSTPEIVQILINHGGRLIARLVDGRTALHLAAARGSKEMVQMLMDKSLVNEEEGDEKEALRKAAREAARSGELSDSSGDESDSNSEASEVTLGSEDTEDSMTMGSFVKIDAEKKRDSEEGIVEDSEEDPDVYEIDVLAWDYGLSPLHLAILNGHLEVVELLVSEYGADVLNPVKLMEPGSTNARAAIFTLVLAISLPKSAAKDMIKLLLKLGVTSAQADMNRVTALHYLVAENDNDALDILLEHDRPAALSVLSNIAVRGSGYYYGANNCDSPLTTALDKGYTDMVSKLLRLGAKPTISFDDWITGYLSRNPYAKNHTPEQNMSQYKKSVTQPIVAAAAEDQGKSIEDLLSSGIDANTLEKQAHSILQNPANGLHQSGESVLDMVQKKLKNLRNYKGEPGTTSQQKPETLNSEKHYMRGLVQGSYQYWTALKDFQSAKAANLKAQESYQESLEKKTIVGEKDKMEAILKLIKEFEKAEKALIAAGAKTFATLHPNLPKRNAGNSHNPYKPEPPMPYDTKFGFQVPNLNDRMKTGYLSLFEAAWNNDLDAVKALTLAPWYLPETIRASGSPGCEDPQSPLQISVKDDNGFSPFSIAVLRGHQDLGRNIIEICKAQYHKDDGLSSRQRWTMRASDSEDEESNDGADLPIFSELVSDKFTVDNVAEVSTVVKSHVLPIRMLEWDCPAERISNSKESSNHRSSLFVYAVKANDFNLFKFMIELASEQQALLAEEEDDQKSFTLNSNVFQAAIKAGRIEMLAYMMKTTGVGIPINELVRKSGVDLKIKPKYYQGLTVGGKKRADWAQPPDQDNPFVVEERVPPLLQAAKIGNLDSVEFFMSDAPIRRFKEFAEANGHDKRIRHLEVSGNGFEKTISKWLNKKSDLLLHCAVLQSPSEPAQIPEYLALIKHLVSIRPEYLEHKSSEGWTPLHVALYLQQEEVVSYLISAGADQRARDKLGRNVVHAMLAHKGGSAKTNPEKLQALLQHFNPTAVKDMLLERCTNFPGALTPLAYWMACNSGSYVKPRIIEVLSNHSTGEDLEMINGEGDLPLHVAVKQGLSNITTFLISLNPALLYRENATGRTPLEMARDLHLTATVQDSPAVFSNLNYSPNYVDCNSITHRSPSSFVPAESQLVQSKKRVYEICLAADEELAGQGAAGEYERKRRLVSLFEANEVAKRAGSRKQGVQKWVFDRWVVDTEGGTDIVSEWMPSS